jgi:hypothetical protein
MNPVFVPLTRYHAKYFAYDLTRRASSGMDRLSMALFDAAVDLNPHQIEAALFALQSPLSKGVILADEVGLGQSLLNVQAFTKQGYSSKDSEFDLIYVNGGNNLENLKAPDDTWKVRLIEKDFHRLMFDAESV